VMSMSQIFPSFLFFLLTAPAYTPKFNPDEQIYFFIIAVVMIFILLFLIKSLRNLVGE